MEQRFSNGLFFFLCSKHGITPEVLSAIRVTALRGFSDEVICLKARGGDFLGRKFLDIY